MKERLLCDDAPLVIFTSVVKLLLIVDAVRQTRSDLPQQGKRGLGVSSELPFGCFMASNPGTNPGESKRCCGGHTRGIQVIKGNVGRHLDFRIL